MEEWKQALIDISKELKKLNKLIALIGSTTFDLKIKKLDEGEQKLKTLIGETKCLEKKKKNRH